jgi:signal transduction histidine kinase
MPKIGDSYCFLIADDPSVCPFISEQDTVLVKDVRARLSQKCLTCEYFRIDLEQLRQEQGPLFEVMLMLLDELTHINENYDLTQRELDVAVKLADETIQRGHKLAKLSEALEIRDEILDILFYLTDTLGWTLNPNEIIYRGLVAFTAGTSFGFNRGVALLMHDDMLKGTFALGPRDEEEANRIWNDILDKGLTAIDLVGASAETLDYERERAKFQDWLEQLTFTVDDAPFKQAFELANVMRVDPEMEIAPRLRDFYHRTPFWILPLFTHVERPLGVMIVDNFLTHRDAMPEDLRAMWIVAKEIALALERGLAHAELQEKLQKLQEANRIVQDNQAVILKLREDMAASEMVLQLTHSVKNPVVAIGGLARLLNRKLGQHSAHARYTQAIVQESTRLEEMLKDFVKFVDARYSSEKEPVNVNQLITVLCQEKERLWHAMKVTRHVKLEAGAPTLLANRRQFYNCLENLVNNAVEAMPGGGDLFLETAFDDGWLTVRVADTGQGMPEEVLQNLFKPFFTTKPTGSGLGLYTAKEIIEGLGGNISIICEPGSGCAVHMKVPSMKEAHYVNHSGD